MKKFRERLMGKTTALQRKVSGSSPLNDRNISMGEM